MIKESHEAQIEKLAIEESFAILAHDHSLTLTLMQVGLKDALSRVECSPGILERMADNPIIYYVLKWLEIGRMLKRILSAIQSGEYELAAELFYNDVPKTTCLKKRKR